MLARQVSASRLLSRLYLYERYCAIAVTNITNITLVTTRVLGTALLSLPIRAVVMFIMSHPAELYVVSMATTPPTSASVMGGSEKPISISVTGSVRFKLEAIGNLRPSPRAALPPGEYE